MTSYTQEARPKADHTRLVDKIHRFAAIEAGWLEGHGVPFDQADLTWFTDALCEHFPSHIPEPNATPPPMVRSCWNGNKPTSF